MVTWKWIEWITMDLCMQDWISINYNDIIQWAKNICKNDQLADDLAHYAIEVFLTHKKYDQVLSNNELEPEKNHAKSFMLSIMRNSWYGKKSEFSRKYKAHRSDLGARKKSIPETRIEELLFESNYDYDYAKDRLVETIQGILEEMAIENEKLWYISKLFTMYLDNPNYSALQRQTGIPRSSITLAVKEAINHIQTELRNRNIDYEF